jgi:hypothetical protein
LWCMIDVNKGLTRLYKSYKEVHIMSMSIELMPLDNFINKNKKI